MATSKGRGRGHRPRSLVGRHVRVTGRDDLGIVQAWPRHPDGHSVVVVRFHSSSETRYYSAHHVQLVDAG